MIQPTALELRLICVAFIPGSSTHDKSRSDGSVTLMVRKSPEQNEVINICLSFNSEKILKFNIQVFTQWGRIIVHKSE